jgi:uncharacterized protein (DUF433 family)
MLLDLSQSRDFHRPPVVSAEPIPLVINRDGIVRIGGTRVTLDPMVAAAHDGTVAGEIVQQRPSRELANVCAIIRYDLRHRREVEAYLRERQQHSEAIRQETEARLEPHDVRERLLARSKLPRWGRMTRGAADEHFTRDVPLPGIKDRH